MKVNEVFEVEGERGTSKVACEKKLAGDLRVQSQGAKKKVSDISQALEEAEGAPKTARESASTQRRTLEDLFPKGLRDWWNPFKDIADRKAWPTRLLETSEWVDAYFQGRVAAEIDRKGHIEKGIGLVFTLTMPLVGLFGFVVSNVDFQKWDILTVCLTGGIVLSALTLLATVIGAAKSWYGHGYARGTPDFETVTQILDLEEDFAQQGFEIEAATYAQEEIRDRMVIANGYTAAINQRVNNLRGVWLHRARTGLLWSAFFVILSATLHICDTRMREFDNRDSEEKHVGKQSKQFQSDEPRNIKPWIEKSEPVSPRTGAEAVFKRSSSFRADQKGQRGRQRRQKQMTEKKEAQESNDSSRKEAKSSAAKSEASATRKEVKARPEASAVPPPSVAITLSESAANPSLSKKNADAGGSGD